MLEATIVKYTRGVIVIYPPKEYQEKLRKHRGKKVKSNRNRRIRIELKPKSNHNFQNILNSKTSE